MPNPAKPTERKRKLGNPGMRKLPETKYVSQEVSVLPEPLRPLGREGKKTWDNIWASASSWISSSTDIQIVQMLCECEDERQTVRVLVYENKDWRDRVALRSLDGFILSVYTLLGFTPADRAKLGLGEVRPASVIDELKARRNSG